MNTKVKIANFFKITALLITTAFVSSSFAADDNPTSSENIPLMTFAWPTSGKVSVVESTLKKGVRSKASYDLVIKTDKDKNRLISYHNYQLLYVEGFDLNDPKVAKQLAPSIAMATVTPGYKVSPKGSLLGVVGLDNMLERLKTSGIFKGRADEAKIAKVWATLKTPMMKQTIEAKVGSNWNGWVGILAGLPNDQEIGAQYAVKTQAATFGQLIPFDVTYERMAVTNPIHKGLTYWHIKTVAETKSIKQALTKFINDMAEKQGDSAKKFDESTIKYLDQRNVVDIITDPTTLMPVWTKIETIVDMQIEGKDNRNKHEVHEYEFTWDK